MMHFNDQICFVTSLQAICNNCTTPVGGRAMFFVRLLIEGYSDFVNLLHSHRMKNH